MSTNCIRVGKMYNFLTPEELSKILKIPKRTIYKFAQEDLIPGTFRIGKHWRFRQDLIEAWFANGPDLKEYRAGKIKETI